MNWLDILIIIFVVASLLRGLEVGFARQFFSTTGFIGGLLAGAWLQGKLITLVDTPASKTVLALTVILGCAFILMALGEYIGLKIKFKLKETRLIDRLDRVLGSILAIVTILAVVWLTAAMFRGVPSDIWRRAIAGSRIVAVLNNNLPPAPNVISGIGHLIDPNVFPQVFIGMEPQLQTDAPLPELGDLRPAVEKARESVVKIQGQGCGGIVEGSGFVAADNLVVTNAHVVAGVENPQVIDIAAARTATVVWFDPNLDLAILRANDLAGEPLDLDKQIAVRGTASVVLGYPQGHGFTASPSIVLDSFNARGRDIYNQNITEREVYAINADVRQGNSGGPLLDADGEVIGVIFAQSVNQDEVGYAFTVNQLASALDQSQDRHNALSTGRCAR